MSAVHLAPVGVEPLVLRLCRHSRTVFRGLRHHVEHVFDQGALSGLHPSVAVDLMPSL